MGKIANRAKEGIRHSPLHADISSAGGNLRSKPRGRKQTATEQDDSFLDAASSRRILTLAKQQRDEIMQEEELDQRRSFGDSMRDQLDPEEALDGSELENDSQDESEYSDFEQVLDDEEDAEVSPNDAQLFQNYFQNSGPTFNLADKILEKIHEREMQLQGVPERPQDAVQLPVKVIAAYEKIGKVLSTYTHGKLPKLFKVLPTLHNWQDVLYVTNPEAWTPHAVYEATKLFVSNLQAPQSQKFIKSVLLPRFQSCIELAEDHTLNYHIYRALKKSLYKPAAFFKGFLLPLVDSYCTVREATIAASVLAKVSVPVLHSSAALTQLLSRDFSPATTVFIRILIEKKYALPYQTIDDLVFYFMRFRDAAQAPEVAQNAPQLPLVWHKAFLAFAQRYKNDITDDQRDFLLETVRQRFHPGMGPEIRRELLAGKPRTMLQEVKEVSMVDAF